MPRISYITPVMFKKLREKACLSRKELAEVLGVSRSSIHNWETGNVAVDVRTSLALRYLVLQYQEKHLTFDETEEAV